MVEFASPVGDDADKSKRRELMREQAKAMMKARPSSVLKDKMALAQLQEEMEKDLEAENKNSSKPKPKKLEPLKIQVKLPNGTLVDIKIQPDDTIPDLKEEIEDDYEIPVEEQKLFNKGKALDDLYSALSECGIQQGDILELNPSEIDFFVQTPNGKKLPMTVPPHITIANLQQKMQDEHGIKADQHKLKFNGESLDDLTATLTVDCGIQPGDAIDLEPQLIILHVQMYNGKKLKVNLPSTANVNDLKEKLQEEHDIPVDQQELEFDGKRLEDNDAGLTEDCGISAEGMVDLIPLDMTVYVVTHEGKKLAVIVKPTSSIAYLTQKVQDNHNILVEKHYFEFESKALHNPDAILESDCGIRPKAVIDMKFKDISVIVEAADGETLPVALSPIDSIATLKEKIQSNSDISLDEHYLTFQGKSLDSADSTMADCGIDDGTTLKLEPKPIGIRVQNADGAHVDVSILPKDSIRDVQEKLINDYGIPLKEKNQTLYFNDEALNDPNATLEDCGIQSGELLTLDAPDISFEIKFLPDGNTSTVQMKLTDSLFSLQGTIEAEFEIPFKDQGLNIKGKTEQTSIDPESTLGAFGLVDGDVLVAEYVLDITIQIRINTPDGKQRKKTMPVPMKPFDTVNDLHMKLDNNFKIPKKEQILKYEEKDLDEPSQPLKSAGIGDNDIVDLHPYHIHVKTLKGEILPVVIAPEFDAVPDLQKRIAEMHDIPIKKQILQYKGDRLEADPDIPLAAYGIKYGDIVDLSKPKSKKSKSSDGKKSKSGDSSTKSSKKSSKSGDDAPKTPKKSKTRRASKIVK